MISISKKISANIVQITGKFDVMTSGFYIYKDNMIIGDYQKFNSIYRIINNGAQFSNDGSVYQEPLPVPVVTPSLEEVVSSKRQEISNACKQAIYDGITVSFDDGVTEHFSLTLEDQINFIAAKDKMDNGVTEIELHHDGGLFRYYTPEEVSKILDERTFHIDYHRAYCNSLNIWIDHCDSIDEIQNITYGIDIPDQYKSVVLSNYLVKLTSLEE